MPSREPIAAGNGLEGRDCQGWRLRHRLGDATGGSALDRPDLEGYTIGSGGGSRVHPGHVRSVSGRKELALCGGRLDVLADSPGWIRVTCCAGWPGVRRRASQGRAGADAGPGAAERRGLD